MEVSGQLHVYSPGKSSNFSLYRNCMVLRTSLNEAVKRGVARFQASATIVFALKRIETRPSSPFN
jgi:hypothetical protein